MKKITLLFAALAFSVSSFSQAPNWDWAKAMNGVAGNSEAFSIAVDPLGNVYTTGWFTGTVDFNPGPGTSNLTSAGGYDIFISKFDSSGNFLWAKRIGGISDDRAASIVIDSSGSMGIYTTGYFFGIVDFNPGAGIFDLTSNGSYDNFICKLDSAANFLWAKSWGNAASEGGNSVNLDNLGNVYIVGNFQGTVDFDPGTGVFSMTSLGGGSYISKLNSAGNFIVAKAFGHGSYCSTIDDMGNIYITGNYGGTEYFDTYSLISNGNYDIFILKLDNVFNFAWAKSIGGIDYDIGYSIDIDALGNVYTTGLFHDTVDFDPGLSTFNLISNGTADIFISKLDNSGNFLWAKSIGSTWGETGYSIAIDAANNVYTTGIFELTVDFDPGPGIFNVTASDLDFFVSKLDNSGNFIWAKTTGGTISERAYAMTMDISGNLYLTGFFDSPSVTFNSTTILTNTNNTANVFVAKLNPQCIAPALTTNFVSPLCYGGTGSAAIIPTGGTPPYSYLWSNNDTAAAITGVAVGTYTVTVTSNAACTSAFTIATVTITQPPQLADSVSSVATDITCIGSATIAVNGGTPPYQYQWSNSGTTATINNLCTGWYYVTVTDANDCQITDSVFVNSDVGINDLIASQNISITPNPATSELIIENAELKIREIEIYSMFGKKVYSQLRPTTNNYQIVDIRQLSSGIYFVRVKTEAGMSMGKFVKE